MNTTDKKISEVLAKFGEPMAGNVWRVQGTAVIYHKSLERIAAQAKIIFDEPKIIRAERDEAVIQVTGRMGERVEWSIGEALIGVNYRVSGKQAAYVYAMAEKRAKDRVILKLIELHGLVALGAHDGGGLPGDLGPGRDPLQGLVVDHGLTLDAPDVAGHRLTELSKHFRDFLIGRIHPRS